MSEILDNLEIKYRKPFEEGGTLEAHVSELSGRLSANQEIEFKVLLWKLENKTEKDLLISTVEDMLDIRGALSRFLPMTENDYRLSEDIDSVLSSLTAYLPNELRALCNEFLRASTDQWQWALLPDQVSGSVSSTIDFVPTPIEKINLKHLLSVYEKLNDSGVFRNFGKDINWYRIQVKDYQKELNNDEREDDAPVPITKELREAAKFLERLTLALPKLVEYEEFLTHNENFKYDDIYNFVKRLNTLRRDVETYSAMNDGYDMFFEVLDGRVRVITKEYERLRRSIDS